ncbi:hypothetical protein VNI00_018862 [Paramarasmius palmivorus]|uniref:MYND-type domain-containing protein n=1 Tax=Paramarasmius palmivorus TaxID=297713 RepID=A0AAW0AUH3_9AGAR
MTGRVPTLLIGRVATPSSAHRTRRIHYVTNCCKACGILVPPPRQRCSRCTMVTYCSPECQRAHWPAHRSLCLPIPALSPDTFHSVPHRLLHAGRKFVNTFYTEVAVVGVQAFLSILDTYPFAANESDDNFVGRFKELTRHVVWVIQLKEKKGASRDQEPHARDVQYVRGSGHRQTQVAYPTGGNPRGLQERQRLIDAKEESSQNSTGVCVGVLLDDKDGNPQAEFTVCVDIADLVELKTSYFSRLADVELSMCGI